MTPLEERTAEAIDATAEDGRAPAWRARVGGAAQLVAPVDPGTDHVRGPADAEVTLVEYGEYECPYCAEAHVELAALEQRYGSALRLVFRHFPLRQTHARAFDASLAAEAAGRQGRFWELHDLLGRSRKDLSDERIRALAGKAGLDVERFDADRADPALRARVERDVESGLASGVNGTPTLFVNGVRYDDDFDQEELARAIDAARAAAAAPSA
jgi:protein-disulfide isomerase